MSMRVFIATACVMTAQLSLAAAADCPLAPNGQWAQTVLDKSTEYGSTGWSASQVLGPCDTLTYGDQQTSWAPQEMNRDKREFITVGFANPVHATGAIIRETYGYGFLNTVEAVDAAGNYHQVWKGTDEPTRAINDFRVEWPRTDFVVVSLRVIISTDRNETEWEEIDSVQLLGEP